MDDQFDDFFNVNKDPVSELSKKKSILDDSDSDDEPPKTSFLKQATLSDSEESVSESVYSDDDFERDSIDEDEVSTVKSVKSDTGKK